MLTSGRPGAFGHYDEVEVVTTAHACSAATSDPQQRIARLRELAREFRRILNECTVFDGRLSETLREVIADLEEEAKRLERGPSSTSTLPNLRGGTAQRRLGGLPD